MATKLIGRQVEVVGQGWIGVIEQQRRTRCYGTVYTVRCVRSENWAVTPGDIGRGWHLWQLRTVA